MKLFYTVIVVLVKLFILTFSLENTEPVSLQYLEYRIVVKTYMLLFISFLAGVVFAGFMGIVERFRLSRTITKLNKTIREFRKDLRANEAPQLLDDKAGDPSGAKSGSPVS